MSKSISEMVTKYVDDFMLSSNNKILIYEAFMHEKQKNSQEFYEIYDSYGNEFIDASLLIDYYKVVHNYCLTFKRAEMMKDQYYDIEDEHEKENMLYSLLYTYIKMDECQDLLIFLSAFFEIESLDADDEDLSKVRDTLNAINVVLKNAEKTENYKTRISFEDVIVKTNIFKCNKNHKIEQIQAIVKIVDSYGDIVEKSVSAGYCEDCKHYFILEKDFQKLKRYGVLLCRVISEKVYYTNKNNNFDLQPESVLHQVGYNVSATEGLSTEQRWEILKLVVDSGLYSVSGLCSFLDYLIDKNQRVTTRDMSNAIYKWQTDRDFIAEYEQDSCRKINVGSFKEKIYEELPF